MFNVLFVVLSPGFDLIFSVLAKRSAGKSVPKTTYFVSSGTLNLNSTRRIWKMLGPFATVSRLTPIHQVSLAVLSQAACASMSTKTTTTTRDREDRYGPMEWAQSIEGVPTSLQ